jgi:hypothetical protein
VISVASHDVISSGDVEARFEAAVAADENGVDYLSYSYDSSGRAITSKHAYGVDQYNFIWSWLRKVTDQAIAIATEDFRDNFAPIIEQFDPRTVTGEIGHHLKARSSHIVGVP